MTVKRLILIRPDDLSNYRNYPYDLSGTAELTPATIHITAHAEIIFDNSFAFLSVNFGTQSLEYSFAKDSHFN